MLLHSIISVIAVSIEFMGIGIRLLATQINNRNAFYDSFYGFVFLIYRNYCEVTYNDCNF